MIIDLILDRQDGKKYNAKSFYNDVMAYYNVFPEIVEPIANCLDNATEKRVKQVLCNYITEQAYNPKICDYINSVKWIDNNYTNII